MIWIRGDWTFDRHMANIRLPLRLMYSLFEYLGEKSEDPDSVAACVQALLQVANDGQYADAQILRIYAPMQEAAWYITLVHSALPAVDVCEELSVLDLTFPPGKLVRSNLNTLTSALSTPHEVQALMARIADILAASGGALRDKNLCKQGPRSVPSLCDAMLLDGSADHLRRDLVTYGASTIAIFPACSTP
jgi:hypothetical protein